MVDPLFGATSMNTNCSKFVWSAVHKQRLQCSDRFDLGLSNFARFNSNKYRDSSDQLVSSVVCAPPSPSPSLDSSSPSSVCPVSPSPPPPSTSTSPTTGATSYPVMKMTNSGQRAQTRDSCTAANNSDHHSNSNRQSTQPTAATTTSDSGANSSSVTTNSSNSQNLHSHIIYHRQHQNQLQSSSVGSVLGLPNRPNYSFSPVSVVNSPSHSSSPVDLHYSQHNLGTNHHQPHSHPQLMSHSDKLCIHRNLLVKCENCNSSFSSFLQSVNKLNEEGHQNALNENLNSALLDQHSANKIVMNSLNSEVLLSHDTKHLFSPSGGGGVTVGLGGNPLTGHLGHIGTSIASSIGISSGVNTGITMSGGHLHPSHHHPSVHQATIHSMSSPGFTIHSHLTVGGGQRRMSNTSSSNATNRTSKSQINNKQFLCPMCNKLFTQKGNLKTHMMIHTGDKPYACHVCGKSFTQKGNVDTHIKIHTGVKDHSCERCGKSFTQRGNLKTHIRSVHTKEKPYACSVCGKSFSQKGNMHTHIRTHNKDDRFPCSLCGKTFSQKGNLKTHMQRHAGTLPKRYGPGGQRRQATSRLLQVPGITGAPTTAAAAAAAAAYAIAAAGNVNNLERNHQSQNQSNQPNNQQLNRNTPVSPQDGGDDSRSPSSMVHVSAASMNGNTTGAQQRNMSQQSVISNVQNQQASRDQQVQSPSQYPGSSETVNTFATSHSIISSSSNSNINSVNTLTHLSQSNGPNSFNLATTPSAAAAAAAVLLSSTSSFSKDHKTNHLHFMSSLFH